MTALHQPMALPGSAEYTAATAVFNLAAPVRPVAAVTARSVDQVRAAIRYAQASGLRVRVHSTGHASGTARSMGDALLVRTELGGGVEVDARRRLARVPAGTRWRAVVEAAAPYGLTAPHGSAAGVGVVGYLLRGGLSFYGRRVGLGVNCVRAVELVTADGELRRVDASNDAELFWAVRGGGGGFGVVTALEIELFAAARVVTGAAFWSARDAERLLRAWRRWCLEAPPEATTSVQILNLPPLEEIPPPLRDGPVLCVDGAVVALDESDLPAVERYASELLDPLRAIAPPLLDTWALTTPSAVLDAHLDPEEPVPLVGEHLLLHELGDDGLAELLRVTGPRSGSPLIAAGLRQLGGAYARPNPSGGALDHVGGAYAYSGTGVPDGSPDAILAHCAVVRAALAPWDTGWTVPSFVDGYQQPQGHLSTSRLYTVDRVRARVDPDGMFRDDVTPGASGPGAVHPPTA